jgi:hypothetical protein
VPVSDEDVAVRRGRDVGGAVEHGAGVARNARLAERLQQPALRIELENLVALGVLDVAVERPEVAVAIEVKAVGLHKHPVSKTREQLARRIEFEDRRIRALNDPQVAAGIELDTADLSPLHVAG